MNPELSFAGNLDVAKIGSIEDFSELSMKIAAGFENGVASAEVAAFQNSVQESLKASQERLQSLIERLGSSRASASSAGFGDLEHLDGMNISEALAAKRAELEKLIDSL